MIKYDYKKFIADNSEGQKFIESEILAPLGAYCIDYGASEENPYACDICFASSYLPPGKNGKRCCYIIFAYRKMEQSLCF